MFLIPAKNQNQTWKYSIYCYLRYDRKQSARRTQMKIQGGGVAVKMIIIIFG